MRFGRLNADSEQHFLWDKLGGDLTSGYNLPMIAYFVPKHKSNAITFEGPHERDAIVTFVRKQLENPVKNLTNAAEVYDFLRVPHGGAAKASMPVVAVSEFEIRQVIPITIRLDLFQSVVIVDDESDQHGREAGSEGLAEILSISCAVRGRPSVKLLASLGKIFGIVTCTRISRKARCEERNMQKEYCVLTQTLTKYNEMRTNTVAMTEGGWLLLRYYCFGTRGVGGIHGSGNWL